MSAGDALAAIKTRAEGHTPGPWELAGGGEWLAPWGIDIGSEDSSSCPTVRPADAELIAAAPRLLAALEAVEALTERFAAADADLYDDDFNKGHCAGYRTAARLAKQAIDEALS